MALFIVYPCEFSMLSVQCIALIAVTIFPAVYADPFTHIVVEEVNVKMEENPFFDPWTVIFDPVGEQVSLKTPIKQDLPPNMMIGIDLILDGIEMMHFESLMCDLFNDPIIGKGIVDHGRPIGVYPTSCPFVANPDLVIENWEFPADKVPPGIPDSSAECTFTVFEKGKPPAVTITGTGKLIHKFPGIGR